MYLFVITDHTNFEAVREAFGKALGLHGNGIADFYIIGFPLLLVYAHLNKNLFSLVNISLAFVAIAITYSRTAYFTIIIEIVLYIILIRKASFLPIVGVAGAIVLKFLPQSILDRAVTGAGAGDANALSAGRTDNIWVPLVSELMRKPGQLFFGNGRYSILHSDAMKNNEILKVIHAHNFYLDTVLDMGLLGLAFFLTFYLMMLMQTNKLRRETKNPFFQVMSSGLTVCVLGFMIRGLSDSSMLPTANNAYIWVIFGFCQLLTMVAEKHPEYSAIQST
jgi:putative inorganic carbon (HCO3(-)) transporter